MQDYISFRCTSLLFNTYIPKGVITMVGPATV